MFSLTPIDTSWTLFLDRDGVLNYEKKEDYIRNWTEFCFYEGVPEAIASLNKII
jgi:D-glycero-D-manno-heptose 1,7-bisphosphate phosphatase